MVHLLRLVPLLLIALAMSACGKGTLTGGVKWHYINGNHALVVSRDGQDVEVVPQNVRWAKQHGGRVYGEIEAYFYSDGVPSKSGYFVLDTRTWDLAHGLTKEEAARNLGMQL